METPPAPACGEELTMVAKQQDPIPQGWYDARVVRSQSTGHRLYLDFAIIGGVYDSCVISESLPLHRSTVNAKCQARDELSQICLAVGVMAPKDSSELHNIPLAIQVGVDKHRNTILSYSRTSSSNCSELPKPRRLQLTRADQIEIHPPDWLLRGMLERDTFALIFGDPGSGKSFLAIDWACRIATGTPWRGHGVKAAPVVYMAGEGQQGFGRRIRAWSEHNGVSLADAPLYVAPAVAIPDVSQLTELVTAIEAQGEAPALVVFDTLARCFGGGDENSTQDMSKFVLACDTIRQRYHCTILVVHHTGHADKSRARGAIALKAALDAEYRLAKTDRLLLTATKMKDAETPAPVAMELTAVDLPGVLDDYGNPVTSAAIEMVDADTGAIVSEARTIRPRGKWQRLGLEVANRLIVAAGDDGQAKVADWHSECEAAGMRQSTRYDVLAKLTDRGEIVLDGETIVTT